MEKKLTLQNLSDKSSAPYKVSFNEKGNIITVREMEIPFKTFCKLVEAMKALRDVKNHDKEEFVKVAKSFLLKHPELSGLKFKGIIDNVNVEGRICIGRDIYFCTNSRSCDGSTAPEKFGYKYSWVYDPNVRDFEVCLRSDEFLETYNKLCKPLCKLLPCLFGYTVSILPDKVFVGCNSFQFEDLLKIYNQIKEEEEGVKISKETLSKVTETISRVFDDLNNLKKTVESISLERTVTKTTTKSGAKRDSNGRFVKC